MLVAVPGIQLPALSSVACQRACEGITHILAKSHIDVYIMRRREVPQYRVSLHIPLLYAYARVCVCVWECGAGIKGSTLSVLYLQHTILYLYIHYPNRMLARARDRYTHTYAVVAALGRPT